MNVYMKLRFLLCIIILCMPLRFSVSQNTDRSERLRALEEAGFTSIPDGDESHQYVVWIRRAIEEDRLAEAVNAVHQALDFSDINSDISFLAAFLTSKTGGSRTLIISFLDTAIEVNRWSFYSENEALVLKAEHLVAIRRYSSAIAALDQIREGDVSRSPAVSLLPLSNDAAMLRLKAFRGIAYNSLGATEIAAFRTLTLSAMNRFSRDPRPAVIFLEYLYFMKKQNTRVRFEINLSDQQVLDLIIRRLPVLAELDHELVWMAAPFMQNEADAKRYTAAYRAGGFLENAAGFVPNPKSIPLALNYGLINDIQAIEELFFTVSPLRIDLEVINDTYAMLRSEEGRDIFTQTLNNFSGQIASDSEFDGIIESFVIYSNGTVEGLYYSKNQDNSFDIRILFDSNGIPSEAEIPVSGADMRANILWERYPFVKKAYTFENPFSIAGEVFSFRPSDFNFAPVEFITLGGSRTHPGLTYPVLKSQINLTRRTLSSFCENIQRRSQEFNGAEEIITLESGIPMQAVEILNEKIISITEFESGIPVIQYVDLDFDGRMETIRRFHRPGQDYPWPDPDERFDYRKLLASSESDWRGDGRYKTGEVYLPDGSVVYQYDIDGTGTLNYSDTNR